MALLIEDGTIVDGANSFVTLVEARAYASDRGIALAIGNDATLTALLIKAGDYLISRADEFVGCVTDVDQSMPWPRKNVQKNDGSLFPSSGAGSIPQALKNAQCQLAIEQQNGISLLPTQDFTQSGYVIAESVDSIETKYSEDIGTTGQAVMRAVEAWLSPLLVNSSGQLRVVRA